MFTLKHLVMLSLAAAFCMTAASNLMQTLISFRNESSEAAEDTLMAIEPHSTVDMPPSDGVMRGSQFPHFIAELAAISHLPSPWAFQYHSHPLYWCSPVPDSRLLADTIMALAGVVGCTEVNRKAKKGGGGQAGYVDQNQ